METRHIVVLKRQSPESAAGSGRAKVSMAMPNETAGGPVTVRQRGELCIADIAAYCIAASLTDDFASCGGMRSRRDLYSVPFTRKVLKMPDELVGRTGDETLNQFARWRAMSDGAHRVAGIPRSLVVADYDARLSESGIALIASLFGLSPVYPVLPSDVRRGLASSLTNLDRPDSRHGGDVLPQAADGIDLTCSEPLEQRSLNRRGIRPWPDRDIARRS